MSERLATYFHCPTEFTLAVLGGKWKTVILSYLKQHLADVRNCDDLSHA